MTIPYRWLAVLGFVACAAAMAFALYLQVYQGLEPCPMCIFQRVAMIATGLVFFVAAVHAPRGGGARGFYSVLGMLMSLAGAGIAARHVWLQGLPPDQVPACGPTLDYLMDVLPLKQVVTTVLSGDGNCAIIDAQFMGVSLPGWTLAAFAGITLYWIAIPILSKNQYRNYL